MLSGGLHLHVHPRDNSQAQLGNHHNGLQPSVLPATNYYLLPFPCLSFTDQQVETHVLGHSAPGLVAPGPSNTLYPMFRPSILQFNAQVTCCLL